MPSNAQALAALDTARGAFVAARSTSQKRLNELAAHEAVWRALRRKEEAADAGVLAAEAAFRQAASDLRRSRTAERAARDEVQAKLKAWLNGFAADALEEVGELSAALPLVLLPVRLETRFLPVTTPTTLAVRIYPDEIMADTYELALTEQERSAGEAYWRRSWNPSEAPKAWRLLVRRYPRSRAAWIVRRTTPTNLAVRPNGAPIFAALPDLRPASWTRAAEACLLPDRWMLLAYREGREVHRAISGPVLDPLALSPDPVEDDPTRLVDISGDGLFVDDDMLWTINYARAEGVGMAVTIQNLSADDLAKGFDRLVVIGVRASLGPKVAADRLAALFQGHRYSRGLAFVRQGTPTNNTADGPSGFPPPDPGGDLSFVLETSGMAISPTSDGARFTAALGIGARLKDDIQHVAGANQTEHANAEAMNRALWPATWGYYLEQMMAPALDQAAIRDAREWFAAYVRGRGPLPAFRVGNVPYGVLPVSSMVRWTVSPTAVGMEAQLPKIIAAIRSFWFSRVSDISRVDTGNDPDGALLEVLSLDASAREVRLRGVWGDEFVTNLFRFFGTQFFGVQGSWPRWSSGRERVAQQMRRLLDPMGWPATRPPMPDPRLARMTFTDTAPRFRHPLVTPEPLSEDVYSLRQPPLPSSANYIHWISQAPIVRSDRGASLWNNPIEEPPLLYLMLRQGMLLEYARAALDILIRVGRASEDERREAELVGIPIDPTARPRARVWERFVHPAPPVTSPQETLEDFLHAGGRRETAETDTYRQTVLGWLMRLPTAELERLLTETLDTCSHRLDAWLTSLATHRLEAMRRSTAAPEDCNVGAYGWAEHVRRAAGTVRSRQLADGRTVYVQTASGGFVHAPSATHAAAAAVLRSGFLTRAAEPRKRFALNLSSARVRAARRLLDAVRQGQPLGAVLGYRFERGLHERNLEKFVAALRARYPLVAYKHAGGPPSGGPAAESVAARNVVDGLSLWRAQDRGVDPFGGLNATADERKALEAERDSIGEVLDGVADLLTAESVYQMIRGNTAAAGAALDVTAASTRPPDPDIVRVPRGGVTLTHRVAVILGDGHAAALPGWPVKLTPRAEAEPHLDGWSGLILGDPRTVKCRVSYPNPTEADSTLRDELEISLADLKLRPLDVLALAGEAATTSSASELDRRVGAAALSVLGPRSDKLSFADLRIVYATDPAANRTLMRSFAAILEVARILLAVISGARPLRPSDLLPAAEAAGADVDPQSRMLSEATGRTKDARAALEKALKALNDAIAAGVEASEQLFEASLGAALFGVPGAVRTAGASGVELLAQASSVATELTGRAEEADRLIAMAGAAADVNQGLDALTRALAAIFGRGFVFLPRFKPAAATASELELALAAHGTLTGQDPQAARKWLQQAARVRAPLSRWRRLVLYATALGTESGETRVVQLPHVEGAKWVALRTPAGGDRLPSGRLSLVLHRVATPSAQDPWVGLALDEWSEIIPDSVIQTGVTFHYDDPGAEAAQAVLIAVPPDPDASRWSEADLVAIVNETLDLAKVRLVDTELLGDLGQLLPASHVAFNSQGDTVSTNFAAMRRGEMQIGP